MTWGQRRAVGTRAQGMGDCNDGGGHGDGGGDDSDEGPKGWW